MCFTCRPKFISHENSLRDSNNPVKFTLPFVIMEELHPMFRSQDLDLCSELLICFSIPKEIPSLV